MFLSQGWSEWYGAIEDGKDRSQIPCVKDPPRQLIMAEIEGEIERQRGRRANRTIAREVLYSCMAIRIRCPQRTSSTDLLTPSLPQRQPPVTTSTHPSPTRKLPRIFTYSLASTDLHRSPPALPGRDFRDSGRRTNTRCTGWHCDQRLEGTYQRYLWGGVRSILHLIR